MKGDRTKLYDSASAFFDLGGSAVMYLATTAAIDACSQAASQGLVVVRIEGGIWRAFTFEARLDCIWDGADPPLGGEAAAENNRLAADFIRRQGETHNAFVLTAAPTTGYKHTSASTIP